VVKKSTKETFVVIVTDFVQGLVASGFTKNWISSLSS